MSTPFDINADVEIVTVNVPGVQGPPGKVQAGNVTTGQPGTNASVSQRTGADGFTAILDFTIPAGTNSARASVASTTNTQGDFQGQWTKLATITLRFQFDDASANLLLLSLGSGSGVNTGAEITARVKQQNPLGQQPVGSLFCSNMYNCSESDFMMTLDTNSASQTVVSLWMKVESQWEVISVFERAVTNYTNIAYVSNQPFQTATPTGLNTWVGTKGESGNWYFVTGLPSTGTGRIGDNALRTDTGDVYQKTSEITWILKGNLKGPTGATGSTGAAGPANTLSIGTVTTGAVGTQAAASITGAAPTQTLNLTIPTGATGSTGPTGPSPVVTTTSATSFAIGTGSKVFTTAAALNLAVGATVKAANTPTPANYMAGTITAISGTSLTVNVTETGGSGTFAAWTISPSGLTGPQGTTGNAATIAVGTVTTGAAGSSAVITNAGTSSAAVFNFTIPQGVQGTTGNTGPANTLSIGTVTTGAAGSSAAATITGTAPNQTLNLTIPQGAAGAGSPDATTTSKGSIQLAGDLSGTAALPTVPGLANKANSTITITAGTGLTGGGDLTANRTLTVSYGAAAGTAVQGNDTRVVADQAAATASIRTIGAGALQAAAGNHTHVSSGITDAASASTASVIMKRDAAGRASVVDPSASTDIATKNYVDTQDSAIRRPVVNAQTVSYTLVLTDERKIVQVNSASATTVTVPLNSAVAFPVGTVIQIQQIGTGAVTLAATGGVTLNAPMGLTMRQFQIYEVQKTATDTWQVYSNGNVTSSGGINNIVQITSAAYTALGTKDATTLYVIVG